MSRKIYAIIPAAAVAGGLIFAAPAAADYYEGLRAYDAERYARAADLWGVSAKRGGANSQFRLAQLYESGQGVAKNYVLAYFWYTVSARGNNHDAGLAAVFLKEKMTKSQIGRATTLATNWRPASRTKVARATAEPANVPPQVAKRRPAPEVVQPVRRAAPSTASTATTSTPSPPTPSLSSQISGGALRRTVLTSTGITRTDLWRFLPLGGLAGSYSSVRAGNEGYRDEQSDRGRWKVEDGNLCLTWKTWYRGRTICYRMTRKGGAGWAGRDVASGETFTATVTR